MKHRFYLCVLFIAFSTTLLRGAAAAVGTSVLQEDEIKSYVTQTVVMHRKSGHFFTLNEVPSGKLRGMRRKLPELPEDSRIIAFFDFGQAGDGIVFCDNGIYFHEDTPGNEQTRSPHGMLNYYQFRDGTLTQTADIVYLSNQPIFQTLSTTQLQSAVWAALTSLQTLLQTKPPIPQGQPHEDPPGLWQLVAGLILMLLAVGLVFWRRTLTPDETWILRVLVAIAAGLAAYFLTGSLEVRLERPHGVITATSGFGVFVLILFFNPGDPKKKGTKEIGKSNPSAGDIVIKNVSTDRSVRAGGQLRILYEIESLHAFPQEIWLGASLNGKGTKMISNQAEDKGVKIGKGSHAYDRSLSIPADVIAGKYTLSTQVWLGKAGHGASASKRLADFVPIGVEIL